jgi:large subunit ribosomal protein L13
MKNPEYTIDATGKRVGKVATEAASVLLNKHTVTFAKNIAEPITVKITNASLLDISEKRSHEEFQRYSGYPSGRSIETWSHLALRRGYNEVLRRVVAGMLPKNKLHKIRMHNLTITD